MDFETNWRNFLYGLAAANIKNICIGIGVFDGVHRGHAELMGHLAQYAREHGSYPVALTFSPHPRTLVSPDHPTKLLIGLDERKDLLKHYGAKDVFIINFNHAFANLEALDFLKILTSSDEVKISCISVGLNWKFGKNGAGDAQLLKKFCDKKGIDFSPIVELQCDGGKISSANIRIAIANGLLKKASEMLGRDFSLRGTVVKGFSFAGSKLEHPTANLVTESEILPPDGVYAARTSIDGKDYLAAVNIGIAPSFEFNRQCRRIEVHLLDFEGNLYGSTLQITLIEYLRNERFFESHEALKEQIISDVNYIRSLK